MFLFFVHGAVARVWREFVSVAGREIVTRRVLSGEVKAEGAAVRAAEDSSGIFWPFFDFYESPDFVSVDVSVYS